MFWFLIPIFSRSSFIFNACLMLYFWYWTLFLSKTCLIPFILMCRKATMKPLADTTRYIYKNIHTYIHTCVYICIWISCFIILLLTVGWLWQYQTVTKKEAILDKVGYPRLRSLLPSVISKTEDRLRYLPPSSIFTVRPNTILLPVWPIIHLVLIRTSACLPEFPMIVILPPVRPAAWLFTV